MDKRKVFDTIPELFDRWRGRYTPALFEFLISKCGLGRGTRVLELGPGTGQATDFALDAGCDYTCTHGFCLNPRGARDRRWMAGSAVPYLGPLPAGWSLLTAPTALKRSQGQK